MWKVICRFYNGGRKSLGTFKTYREADEFMRNPGEGFKNMPCGVWCIEKAR